MAKTFDYSKRADECSLRAAISSNDQARDIYRTMEAYWRKRIDATKPAESRTLAKADDAR